MRSACEKQEGGKVLPFRRPGASDLDRTLDDMSKVLVPTGPRKDFLDARAVDDSVQLEVAALEIWVSPAEARRLASKLRVAADEAERFGNG